MRLSALYQKITGDRVPAGPFRGMRHPAREIGSGKGIGARILGTYEMELWGIVEDLCQRPHDGIVNIGAAEGYYTIGLALRKPDSRTIAYEAEPEIAEALRTNVRLNAVEDRIRLAGLCQLEDLRAALADLRQPLVLIDVEGAERHLLDPVKIPALTRSEILAEIHDFVDPQIGAEITARFQATHRITEVWTQPRTERDIPPGLFRWLAKFMADRGVRFLDEGRGTKMRWFHLRPLAS
jgi:hypothetical protein